MIYWGPRHDEFMVIWVNGAFGAGKTSLVKSLKEKWADSIVYDPEMTGSMLFKLLPHHDLDNFQDLPIWRTLVIETILQFRKHYPNQVLLVPMTLVDAEYLAEIFEGLSEAGETIRHFYLDIESHILRDRIREQIVVPVDSKRDEEIRKWRLAQVNRCVNAATKLPEDTFYLDSGRFKPNELAEQVISSLPDC